LNTGPQAANTAIPSQLLWIFLFLTAIPPYYAIYCLLPHAYSTQGSFATSQKCQALSATFFKHSPAMLLSMRQCNVLFFVFNAKYPVLVGGFSSINTISLDFGSVSRLFNNCLANPAQLHRDTCESLIAARNIWEHQSLGFESHLGTLTDPTRRQTCFGLQRFFVIPQRMENYSTKAKYNAGPLAHDGGIMSMVLYW
jgi:hypothetical protein